MYSMIDEISCFLYISTSTKSCFQNFLQFIVKLFYIMASKIFEDNKFTMVHSYLGIRLSWSDYCIKINQCYQDEMLNVISRYV